MAMDDTGCISMLEDEDNFDDLFVGVNNRKQLPEQCSDEEIDKLFEDSETRKVAEAKRVSKLAEEAHRKFAHLFIPQSEPDTLHRIEESETTAESVTKSASPAASSGFPVTDLLTIPTATNPVEELVALMAELRIHGDYARIRDRYCQLSIQINIEGLLAPAFRTPPKPGAKRNDPVFKQIHRDQLVIDCHWLQSQDLMVKPRDLEFCPMFNKSGPFPFDLAWKFANKVWKKEHRAEEALSLTTFQQCQLATLRGPTVAERFDLALNGVRTPAGRSPAKVALVKKGLAEWCERNVRIVPLYEDYKSLWLARELLDKGASNCQIGKLHGLICGRPPLSDATISGKIKTMEKQLKGYF
jgi:hypothetical protein